MAGPLKPPRRLPKIGRRRRQSTAIAKQVLISEIASAPPASAEWREVTIPFGQFRRGGWSEDENDRLDLNDVAAAAIGVHGVARGVQARGSILAAQIELVP